jgi:hypothetical protein
LACAAVFAACANQLAGAAHGTVCATGADRTNQLAESTIFRALIGSG